MRQKPNDFNPLFYYLAALTAEVAKGHTKGKRGTTIKERLLKFIQEEVAIPQTPIPNEEYDSGELPPEVLNRMNQSKAAWFSVSGLNNHGQPNRKRSKRLVPRTRRE